jgi:hypothetical protein
MKTLISILPLLLSLQVVKAQENAARKDFLFVDPVTKEQIKIETGNEVAIRFKLPDVRITGTILSISDSSLILGVRQEPFRQLVPFWNIATMTVIAEAKKRYIVRVTWRSGKKLTGELIRTTRDSLSILKNRNARPIRMEASEIKSIQIRRKKAVRQAIGIGAGMGGMIGGIIGYDSTPSELICSGCGPWNDLVSAPYTIIGGVIGAASGSLVGYVVGSAGRKFKIEGDQAKFDLFANKFKNKVSPETSK